MPSTRETPLTGQVVETDTARAGPGVYGADAESCLAVVAHELRNPLAAILYAVGAMTEQGDDPTACGPKAVVQRQARRAARIVDDLFDACAGPLGKLTLRPEVVDVAEIVAVAAETTRPLMASRGHCLTVSLPPEPLRVSADRLRLEQVLTNLLANAAQYTDPGGHVRRTAERDAGHVVIRVRDDGLGIASHLLPRVFDLYAQYPASEGQRPGGLGIGLALVKSLVELHGGRVTVASEGAGRGAEFVVRLPALRPEPVSGRAVVISPYPIQQPCPEQS